MKDEIKEILNEIGYYQHIHENLTLSPKELDILVDCITNLQEERKTLYRYTPEKGFELVGDENAT